MTMIAWSLPLGMVELPSRAVQTQATPVSGEGEWAWVQAARGGDTQAYRSLVDRYRERIFGLAMRIVRDREAAEEIAQDSFVRAWQALPDFRGESRFSTWLYRIAYRRALDERAAADRRRGHEIPVESEALESTGTHGARPSDWGLRLRLERLVNALPEAQRACITLFYAGDQSIEEIARVQGVPAGTVKTNLFRGREELRRLWKKEYGEDFDAPR
jgi:RNA polymerase sigma-70 factor (ECF subfamily)